MSHGAGEQMVKESVGRALDWAKALLPQAILMGGFVGSFYVGVRLSDQRQDSRLERIEETQRARGTLDPDGFRDPAMRRGVDLQIRTALKEYDQDNANRTLWERLFDLNQNLVRPK